MTFSEKPSFFQLFMQTYTRQSLNKAMQLKFHRNSSSGTLIPKIVISGRKERRENRSKVKPVFLPL